MKRIISVYCILIFSYGRVECATRIISHFLLLIIFFLPNRSLLRDYFVYTEMFGVYIYCMYTPYY